MTKIWIFLILGIMIRVFLSATTFHPDSTAFNLGGKLIASGNILNLYDFIPNLPKDDPIKNISELIYPPLIYIYHGIFNFLFNDILKMPFVNQFLKDSPQNYGNIQFNLYLLILKLPYLFFDLAIGFLLLKLFPSVKQSTLAFGLWMFNPVSLYATYMMGQFDIIPTFFTLLSLILVMKNRLGWAALALGGGIAFKIFPIFLVIPLVILGKNSAERIKLIILSILPYILSILPYIHSSNFRSSALLVSQSSKSLYANIPVSGGEAIILFPAALIFIYLLVWKNKNKMSEWKVYLCVLLLFFIFTHFHPQWFIWVTPFLIMSLVAEQFKNILPVVLILTSWIGSLFFFDPSLTIGIFSPLIPSLYHLPPIWNLLHLSPDYNFSRSILQTIFVGASFYLIYEYLTKETKT